jgi:cyanate permease
MVWPEFFGRAYIGSIVGIAQPFTTIAGATAPVIVGALFDTFGSYDAALWMLVGSWLLCAMVMVIVQPAARREASARAGAVSG